MHMFTSSYCLRSFLWTKLGTLVPLKSPPWPMQDLIMGMKKDCWERQLHSHHWDIGGFPQDWGQKKKVKKKRSVAWALHYIKFCGGLPWGWLVEDAERDPQWSSGKLSPFVSEGERKLTKILQHTIPYVRYSCPPLPTISLPMVSVTHSRNNNS